MMAKSRLMKISIVIAVLSTVAIAATVLYIQHSRNTLWLSFSNGSDQQIHVLSLTVYGHEELENLIVEPHINLSLVTARKNEPAEITARWLYDSTEMVATCLIQSPRRLCVYEGVITKDKLLCPDSCYNLLN